MSPPGVELLYVDDDDDHDNNDDYKDDGRDNNDDLIRTTNMIDMLIIRATVMNHDNNDDYKDDGHDNNDDYDEDNHDNNDDFIGQRRKTSSGAASVQLLLRPGFDLHVVIS